MPYVLSVLCASLKNGKLCLASILVRYLHRVKQNSASRQEGTPIPDSIPSRYEGTPIPDSIPSRYEGTPIPDVKSNPSPHSHIIIEKTADCHKVLLPIADRYSR